jgi:hypothetical protein
MTKSMYSDSKADLESRNYDGSDEDGSDEDSVDMAIKSQDLIVSPSLNGVKYN